MQQEQDGAAQERPGPPAGPPGTDPAAATAVIGRVRERALLAAALDAAATRGEGTSLLVRGAAGIGKTALAEWARERAEAAGFRTLRAVGAEAESGYAFGVLHQVLWPLLSGARGLAADQRLALERALGAAEGLPPQDFTVGEAALSLLAEAAARRPLLVVLDDLHWTDSSSLSVFGHIQRRLDTLPVVLLATTRPIRRTLDGWTHQQLELGPLDRADAGALLGRLHPRLARHAAERVLREAAGNPLALVELPRHLTAEHRTGILPLPAHLPLGRRLERVYTDRLGDLPPGARALLLRAALAGTRTLPETDAGTASETEADAAAVEALGLARRDAGPHGTVWTFRHPLVRSAVVAAATPAERRRAHQYLAAVLPADDERRVMHEAAAAVLPDEDLAARVQAAGDRMAQRGGDAEAAWLLARAAELSTGPERRAGRLIWAAIMAARGGRLNYTAELVAEIGKGEVPEEFAPLYAYAVCYVDHNLHSDFASSLALLPGVLDTLARPGAEALRALLSDQIFFKLLVAGTYTNDDRAWQALERHLPDATPMARICHRAWVDLPRSARGLRAELWRTAAATPPEEKAGAAWHALWAASALDAIDEGEAVWERLTRTHGYATQGLYMLTICYQGFVNGRWQHARTSLEEACAAEELGYHFYALMFRHHLAHYLAGRGEDEALGRVDAQLRPVAEENRLQFVTQALTGLRALCALAHERYDDAYDTLRTLISPGVFPRTQPRFHMWLTVFVEAAVHTGRAEEARVHVDAARALGVAEISAHHAFVVAAATALVADAEEADAAYRAAYAVPDAGHWVFDLARLRLAHGTSLRRRARTKEARDRLLAARADFERLAAPVWVARCDQELQAAGAGRADGAEVLTGQERRIAELAATGLTNREIGARLGLSPRTVGAHLYKIFPKLGITSRAALAEALRGS
ncbi:LuxR family transcriptional regulator [Streptomyces fumigatiscleroticus]|nr:LuxR family transcriptional regulator [Streptomyces fumigatiscleroticus]